MQCFTLLGDTPKPLFLQGRALPYSYFLRREERSKEASTPSKASPYMGRMQFASARDRPTQRFWYRSQSLCPKGRAMILHRLRWTLVDLVRGSDDCFIGCA